MTSKVDERLLAWQKTAMQVSLGLTLLSMAVVGIAIWGLPSYIPIWFSRPFGLKQLADYYMLVLYPVMLGLFYGGALTIYRKVSVTPATMAVFLWLSVLASGLLFFSLAYVLYLAY